MNAFNPPIRAPQIDRWADLDAQDDAIADDLFSGRRDAERLRRVKANTRLFAEADEILTRTRRLVDRLCPPPLIGWQSSRYPELNAEPTLERMLASRASIRRRDALHRLIRPRIEAKVRGRAA